MHTNEGVHKILNISWIYDLLQMAAGSDRVYKKICSSINPEASVLDIGCGTATVVNYLPKNINYLGYDFSQHYIDTAKKNFHGKKSLKFIKLNAYEAVELKQKFDFVLILGLLHHLDDIGVNNVLETAARHMHNDSILITVDPTIYNETTLIAKYLISKDRGKAIRNQSEIRELARNYFNQISHEERSDLYRFPWSHVIMKMKK